MSTTPSTVLELTYLSLDRLGPHPDNVRKNLGDLAELTKSIDGTGILEPLLVLPPNDEGVHLVVAGHRRLAAALKATSVTSVPCVIRDLDPAEVVEAMLVENLQRAEISPVEEAQGYARLVELGTTVTTIAKKVGRTPAHVKGRLALTTLPAPLLRLIEDGTLTLAKAADIAAHADDPDAMEWITDEVAGMKAHEWDWFNPGTRLARYISDRNEKDALDREAAKLDKAGLTRFDPPRGWWQRAFLELDAPCKVELLELDKVGRTAHAKEPCHQVLLEIKDRAAPELKVVRIPMCMDPRRHTTAADEADRSAIQIPVHELDDEDAASEAMPGAHLGGGAGAAERAAEYAAAEQRRQARAEAAAARFEFVRSYAAATPSGLPDLVVGVILGEISDGWGAGEFADLAGVSSESDGEDVDRIYQAAVISTEAADRDPWAWAWIFTMAEGQERAMGPKVSFVTYLRFLESVGYELCDYEIGFIAEHEAELAAAAVPDVDAMEFSDEVVAELLILHTNGLANREATDRTYSIAEGDPALIEDLRMRGLLETTGDGDYAEGKLTETGCVVATILAEQASGGHRHLMAATAPASRATVRRRRPSSNVLRRLMEDFDASTPDGMLHALADVGAVDITIRSVPRRGRHGAHAVTWTQGGRRRTEEGSTLDTALRAAVRSAEAARPAHHQEPPA